MRITRFVFCCVLAGVALAGCRGLKVDNAHISSENDWLTEGDTPMRQHLLAETVPPPLQEVWKYNAGAAFGPGSPLVLGDVVMAATRKGELHAIDLETGKRVGFDSFGDALEGTPVVNKGTLYIPVGWGKRVLYAYDLAHARTRWTVRGTPIEAGLLAVEGDIIAVNISGKTTRYNGEDGSVRWEQTFGEKVLVNATPLLAAGHLIVADTEGRVVAMQPSDGKVVWTQKLDAPVYFSPSTNNEVLAVSTTRGLFYGLDAQSGSARWRIELADATVRFAPPASSEDMIYVAATDGILRAHDASTGAEQWTFEIDAAFAAPPLITRDVLYIGSLGNDLYAIDRKTGKKLWETELEGRVKSAMAARDDKIIVLTEPRYVYVFEPSGETQYASTP